MEIVNIYKTFETWDEEIDPEDRLSDEIKDFLRDAKMDTVNKEYIIRVEISEIK